MCWLSPDSLSSANWNIRRGPQITRSHVGTTGGSAVIADSPALGMGTELVWLFYPFTIIVSMHACMRVKSLQLCPTLCDPTDCSPPGSSVHGILQARILEWVAMPFSRGSSQLRDWTWIFCIAGGFVAVLATRVRKIPGEGNSYPFQYSCLENSMDRRVCRATVHGITKSWTWLRDER